MDLRILVLLLVGSLDHSETIIANKLLSNLFWLAVIGPKRSRNTSRIESANVRLMLSQISQLWENLMNLRFDQSLLIPILYICERG